MTFPEGLTEIPDSTRADAYEATGARWRAWIKSTLALVESIHGPVPASGTRRMSWPERGCSVLYSDERADWALCVLSPGFESAPRLAAALMCARLAGVPVTAVLHGFDAEKCPEHLLATLELAGIEHIFTAAGPSTLWQGLVSHLNESFGHAGRVLLFGGASEPGLPECWIWKDRPPHLLVAPGAEVDESVIRWAHPDALPGTQDSCEYPEAAYVPHGMTGIRAALCLTAGLEGCWLHTSLGPDFFMTRQTTLTTNRIPD